MPFVKVRFGQEEDKQERILVCEEQANLMEVLKEGGIPIHCACNGVGMCGKCKICLSSGNTDSMTKEEKEKLNREEQGKGIRLACMIAVSEDLEIELIEDYWRQEQKGRVLSQGFLPEFEKDDDLKGYGLAVDIGTTTVVLSLVDCATGAEIMSATSMNPQRKYGQDVLSRITYVRENQNGTRQLQQAIVNCINHMIDEVCQNVRIEKSKINAITVAANCTMMHFLLGQDASKLGVYPYEPRFVAAQKLQANQIGIALEDHTMMYCIGQVSAFIGADIVAGAYACGLNKETKNVLFVDIGTNGEMVLASKGRLYSCSCAAGPALEGMNIRYGMSASEGAIEEIAISPKGIELTTIGSRAPKGICGSGILAVIRELLRTGLMKKSGVLMKIEELEERDYRSDMLCPDGKKRLVRLNTEPEILVTQDDIRQVQLAKGALLSGIITLLRNADMRIQDLDKVIIAGQFGAHLCAESLTEVGIVPKDVYDKLTYVGNSSKSGAYMALLSQKVRKDMEDMAGRMEYIELADQKDYQELFMECMRF